MTEVNKTYAKSKSTGVKNRGNRAAEEKGFGARFGGKSNLKNTRR